VKRKAMLAWDVKQEAQFQTRFCCFICGWPLAQSKPQVAQLPNYQKLAEISLFLQVNKLSCTVLWMLTEDTKPPDQIQRTSSLTTQLAAWASCFHWIFLPFKCLGDNANLDPSGCYLCNGFSITAEDFHALRTQVFYNVPQANLSDLAPERNIISIAISPPYSWTYYMWFWPTAKNNFFF
jgi:hypothetical protein